MGLVVEHGGGVVLVRALSPLARPSVTPACSPGEYVLKSGESDISSLVIGKRARCVRPPLAQNPMGRATYTGTYTRTRDHCHQARSGGPGVRFPRATRPTRFLLMATW